MAGRDTRERAALVVTVLNEARSIDALMGSIAAQTRAPDEIVIVDGGSRDGTLERLRDWTTQLPLQTVEAPGANIARGRNLGIAVTTAELIAVTDAGVRLAPDWLEQLLACSSADVDVVSGFFVPEADSVFEKALAATVLPALDDVRADRFLPSSRSVLFRRDAWHEAGGYPEWLDYCEDLVFDLALQRVGCRFAFAPRAVVWFRPRGSLKSFFVQYFHYARGDGKADLWRRRHALRYAVYALALVLAQSNLGWLAIAAGAIAYTRRPYQRLAPMLAGLSGAEMAGAHMLVPIIRLVGDVAKMLGYPVGLRWRWTSRSSS